MQRVDLPYAGKYIYQSEGGQPVSNAAQYLQEYVFQRYTGAGLRVLDAGSGSGIIAIMLALRNPDWQIEGLEIQEDLYLLSLQNAELCGVSVKFLHADLREYHLGSYDLILSNPPWKALGSGVLSPNPSRNISRHELCCNMGDLCGLLQRCLKPEGRGILIYPELRKDDLMRSVAKTSLDILHSFSVPDSKGSVIFELGFGTAPQGQIAPTKCNADACVMRHQ